MIESISWQSLHRNKEFFRDCSKISSPHPVCSISPLPPAATTTLITLAFPRTRVPAFPDNAELREFIVQATPASDPCDRCDRSMRSSCGCIHVRPCWGDLSNPWLTSPISEPPPLASLYSFIRSFPATSDAHRISNIFVTSYPAPSLDILFLSAVTSLTGSLSPRRGLADLRERHSEVSRGLPTSDLRKSLGITVPLPLNGHLLF